MKLPDFSKPNEVLSWARTFVADVIIEFMLGLLLGLQELLRTGDFSQAALIALGSAALTATTRSALKKLTAVAQKTKEVRDQNSIV